MSDIFERFTYNPVQLDIPRSKINMRHSHKTTYDTGRLIPIYWREVVPGSTCKMNMSEVTRMQTPIFPIMDNAFIDTYFFFVPNRILWEHWEEFMGENKSGFWEQKVEYTVPQIEFCHDMTAVENTGSYWKGDYYYPYGPQCGSLADYLGVPIVDANKTTPVTKGEFEVNALPFRAYYQIFNDWFRDENLMYPKEYDKGDATITAYYLSSDREDTFPVEKPFKVAKFHDRFTSALPQPQKHDDVLVPLGTSAPVIGNGTSIGLVDGTTKGAMALNSNSQLYGNTNTYGMEVGHAIISGNMGTSKTVGLTNEPDKSGLIADLSLATGASINTLRQAFAVQRYYEKLARGGKVA